jgi:hypothetical protein
MKRKIFYVLIILVFVTISTNLLDGVPQEEWDADNFGKVVIQIFDKDTGEKVNEIFTVYFFKSLDPWISKSLETYAKTNNKGYLVIKLKPGIYYLQFIPESCQSKYELEPSPNVAEENRQMITVESGKITEVLKKANYGGKLKVILVDPTGRKINPKEEFFEDIALSAFLDSENLSSLFMDYRVSISKLTGIKRDLSDGEAVVGRLYPGNYDMSIDFGSLGIRKQNFKGVVIFRNQTTVKEIVIDVNASTGIEGYVIDHNGVPLKDLEVEIQDATSVTDKNGYYRVVGIDEGRHLISISHSMVTDDDLFINKSLYIEIIKNVIIRKDFVIEIK